MNPPTTDHPSPDAKEFLLEEYRSLSKAIEVNEQIGETRVNWLIGVVTAVIGGLVAMLTAEKLTVTPATRQVIAIAFLVGLLTLGFITLHRILKRNATTDGFKKDLQRVRDIFRDYYDPNGVLIGYRSFGPAHTQAAEQETKKENTKEGGSKEDAGRKFGGLADLVAALNSFIVAALAGTISSSSGAIPLVAAAFGGLAFVGSLIAHHRYIQARHNRANENLRDMSLTHAGGVVVTFRDGVLKYLVARPTDDAKKWIFPKGKINQGEDSREAALREVVEETGVRARLLQPLLVVHYKIKDTPVSAQFYLMRPVIEGQPIERTFNRQPTWLSFDEAIIAPMPDEARNLLVVAERCALALHQQTS